MSRHGFPRRKLKQMAVRAVDQLIFHGVKHLEVVQHEDADGDLAFFVWDAQREVWEMERPRLLASRDNPGGYTLEELLAQVRSEYASDSLALMAGMKIGEFDDQDRAELSAREKVIALLYEAEGRQRVISGNGLS